MTGCYYKKLQCLRCGHWFFSPQGASDYCSTCQDVEFSERGRKDAARREYEREQRR